MIYSVYYILYLIRNFLFVNLTIHVLQVVYITHYLLKWTENEFPIEDRFHFHVWKTDYCRLRVPSENIGHGHRRTSYFFHSFYFTEALIFFKPLFDIQLGSGIMNDVWKQCTHLSFPFVLWFLSLLCCLWNLPMEKIKNTIKL